MQLGGIQNEHKIANTRLVIVSSAWLSGFKEDHVVKAQLVLTSNMYMVFYAEWVVLTNSVASVTTGCTFCLIC